MNEFLFGKLLSSLYSIFLRTIILTLFLIVCLPIVFAYPGGIGTNLTLWLNAENTSTLFQDSCGGTQSSSDGDRIGCWEDSSGNSRDFISSGGLRPTLKIDTRAINFNPTLLFDGSEDYLEDADGENYINGLGEFSTFVVVDSDTAAADNYIFNAESDASGAEAPWGMRFDDAGALSGKDDTLKTGIDTGTEVLYEGNESNIARADPLLIGLHWTSGETVEIHVDGRSVGVHPSTTSSGTLSNADYARIGHQGGHSYWDGTIAELIFYHKKLSSTEQQKIQSYLAIKYGITLNSSTNYIDSSESVLWGFSSHGSYINDIAGIFKDALSGLNQNKSKSSNPDSVVTIAGEEDFDDTEALMWGNNNGTSSWSGSDAPNGYKILTRIWETQETGEVGNVTISLDVEDSDYNISDLLYGSLYYFIYDTDDDNLLSDETPIVLFDDGTHGDETSSDNVWTINSTNLGNNTLFSFATEVTPYPGGVEDVEFWLKANAGVSHSSDTVTDWQDQVGTNTIIVLGDPQTNQAEVNFNNMVELDGIDDSFDGDTVIGMREVFLVCDADNDAPALTSNVSITGSTQQYWLRVISGKAYIGDSDPDYIHSDDDVASGTVIYNHEMVGGSAGTESRIVFNGENQSVTSISGNDPLESFSNRPRVGKSTDPAFSSEFDGLIGEIIVYNRSLNITERTKVHSYLAIKYGITLHNALNYLDSSGNILFASTTTHENYTSNIVGIGRDDGSLLNQTRSRSIHNESMLSMNDSSDLDNAEFLIWGHNNASLVATATDAPGGKNILQRIWRVDQSGDVGTVDITMNISLLNLSSTNQNDLFLVKNESGIDFSSIVGIRSNYSDSTTAIFFDVDFNGDDFFTLAMQQYPLTLAFIFPTLSDGVYHPTNSFVINISSNASSLDHYTFTNFDNLLTFWMRMDDVNSSGDPTDIAKGYNGSLVGNALINTTGRFGDGAHFDGSGDYINLVSSSTLIPHEDSWSISTWFNTNSISSKRFGNRIITIRSSNTDSLLSLTLGNDNQLQIFYRDQGGSGTTVNITSISTQTWYHYVVTYNGSVYTTYVNGILNTSIADTINQPSSHIGRIAANPDASTEYFNGSIDEVLIFNRTLFAAEVLSLYNASANQYDNNFTHLVDGGHTFIGHTVNVNGVKNQTELRTITIDTILPLIAYSGGTLANDSSVNQNFIFVNVSVTETNEANITFRLFNSSFGLLNETIFGAGNRSITFTSLSDAVYYYNVTSLDLAGHSNTTELRKITLDTSPPSVTNIQPSGQTLNTSSVISINASVVDTNIDTVLANITYPNNTITQLLLTQLTGNVYGANFTIPVLSGVYNITIIANDTIGSVNSSEYAVFLADLINPNDINTILAWYDGADNSTLFTDSTCVTQVSTDNEEVLCWLNKAGGSNASVVSGKYGARFRSASVEKISSSTTLRFNKTNETVYETGVDIRANTTEDITLFAVYRPRTTNTSDQGQGLWGNNDGSWDRFYYSLFSQSGSLGTDGIDDGLISLGGASQGLAIDGAGIVDSVFLLTAIYNGNVTGGTNSGPVNGSRIYFDGGLQTVFTDQSHATSAETQLYLGWDGDNGHYDGDLAEIIVYDRILTLCQIQLVNNYLGEKYGKDFSGIGNSYGFSAPHNNSVNGISEYVGNCSVSTEVTTASSSIATISNPSSLDVNDSLTFGHNNLGFSLNRNVPQNYTRRISQSWRVDVDNTPGTVSLSFDILTTGINVSTANFTLLIDSDANFSNASVHTTGYSISGTVISFTNVNLSHGHYFTLGLNEPSPGISFVSPSLSDGVYHPTNSFVINISSTSVSSDHYTFVDFDSSLVLWMRMDDVNGSGDPGDISGNSNNGSLLGNALINTTGRFGDALQLDGNGDYINISDDPSLKLGVSNFTYALWFRSNDVPNEQKQLLGKRNSASRNYEVQIESGGRIKAYIGESSFSSIQSGTVIAAYQWYHVLVTRYGGTMYLYVNGALENQTGSTHNVTSDADLWIGADVVKSLEFFNGSIDEVLIFNRSFSAAEVLSLYNASANQYDNNFTNLSDGTHTFIGYAVAATGKKNQTELRSVTIDATPPSLLYSGGTLANDSSVNQNFIFVNVSVTETNEANITFRLFNSSFGLLNETIFGAGNRSITFTSLSDAVYYYNVTSRDLASNSNTTELRKITLDTSPPSVTNIQPSGKTFNSSTLISINASVIDTNLDTVLANVTYPNSTITQLLLTQLTGNVYGANFTLPAHAGIYNITIIANDSAANVNDSEYTTFVGSLKDPSDISGLRAWYDATDNSTLYTDDDCSTPVSSVNEEVQCWGDKSSYQHNATNISGKGRPEFVNNRFNGHSVLNFSKSEEDTLRHTLASQYTSNLTLFIVIQSRDSSPEEFDAFFSNGQPSGDDHFQIDYDGSGSFRANGLGTLLFEAFNTDINLYSLTHDGSVATAYSEGSVVNTSSTSLGRIFEHYRINQNRQGDKYHNSYIGEIILYDRVLNACELEMVHLYLGEKFGRDFFGVEDSYNHGSPYNNDVNGIGRYLGNCSSTVDITTATSGFVTLSDPSSLQLNDSLTIGHDAGGIALVSESPSSYVRVNQSWRVDKDDGGVGDSDSVGTVTVSFDVSSNTTLLNYDHFVLLIDSDGDFTNANITGNGSVSGTQIIFTLVNFTHGDYFTLGLGDNNSPAVFGVSAAPNTTYDLSAAIDISANITDNLSAIDTVLANITLPSGSITQLILLYYTGDRYNATFTVSSLIGNYTVRIIANDTLGNINSSETVTFEVQNDVPDPSGVSINGGSDITLSSGVNTSIIGSATITDLNGYTHIANVTGYLFLTQTGINSTTNNSDYYTTRCVDNGDGGGNTVSYNCTFNVSHYAVPTDAGSNRSATNWTFFVSPKDSEVTGTNSSAVTELNTLASFTITPSVINFGEIALGANTTNINQHVNVTNLGNVGLDVLLSGTNLSCNTSSIGVTFLEYEDDPFNYGSGTDLSESSVELNLNALVGTELDPKPLKTTYYGLGVPVVAVGGSCNGSIVILGQSDPHND